MTPLPELIPELALWNNGKGIAPDDWIFIQGRADHSLGFCSLLWPEFVQFEDYVLRGPLDVARLRGWERAGHARQQVETAMNVLLLEGAFPQDSTDASLKEVQCERLATIMADMLAAKLIREFPARRFAAFVLGGDDFGVSFHQI